MKLYGGIDLHSNNSVIALLDEEDKVVYRRRLANDLELVLAELAPFREAIEGLVVELRISANVTARSGDRDRFAHRGGAGVDYSDRAVTISQICLGLSH